MFQLIPIYFVTRDEIVRPCDSQETCYYIKTYENGLSNLSENLRIAALLLKLTRSIFITKSIDLQLFSLILYGVGGPL